MGAERLRCNCLLGRKSIVPVWVRAAAIRLVAGVVWAGAAVLSPATAHAQLQLPSPLLRDVNIPLGDVSRSEVVAEIAQLGEEYGLAVKRNPENATVLLEMYSFDLSIEVSPNMPWDAYGLKIFVTGGHVEPFERRVEGWMDLLEHYVASTPGITMEVLK
jgi:hypothetical protein